MQQVPSLAKLNVNAQSFTLTSQISNNATSKKLDSNQIKQPFASNNQTTNYQQFQVPVPQFQAQPIMMNMVQQPMMGAQGFTQNTPFSQQQQFFQQFKNNQCHQPLGQQFKQTNSSQKQYNQGGFSQNQLLSNEGFVNYFNQMINANQGASFPPMNFNVNQQRMYMNQSNDINEQFTCYLPSQIFGDFTEDFQSYQQSFGRNVSTGNSSGDEDNYEKGLSNESLSSFITDSPFSFRNPIFFSVPRDHTANQKQVAPIVSKRHLFTEEENEKLTKQPLNIQQEIREIKEDIKQQAKPVILQQKQTSQQEALKEFFSKANFGAAQPAASSQVELVETKTQIRTVVQNQGQFKSITPMPKLQQRAPQRKLIINEKMRETLHQMKHDLVETPVSKHRYKQFTRDFKEAEKRGFDDTVKVVFEKILGIPKKIHWRILLDLSDFAKRESKFNEAKILFKLITYLQPFAYQGWLEFAKMEEECLRFSALNENLFVKAIKVEEKSRNFEHVRKLLGALKDVPFEKSWRMVLEGALFEGRSGNKEAARKAFRHLLKKCQSYGPIYLEASKYEEREGEIDRAIKICEEGLQYNMKYGPLWFQYLRLYEKGGFKRVTPFENLDNVIRLMFANISRELCWKIYIEAAQTYERINDKEASLDFLSNSVINSPDNLKWKVWLIASRIEYKLGNVQSSKMLIERCCLEVPSKQVSLALLEYAKFYEMEGQTTRARQIMNSAKRLVKQEWKLYFEAVMLEMRNGYFTDAEEMVKQSLKIHFATGRLWATLIQLQHARSQTESDFEQTYKTFIKSLHEIPKSGEVWCEGARLLMNNHPNNKYYHLETAKQHLEFAIQFTPQYGDSFLEMIRFCLITKDTTSLSQIKQYCIHAEPNYGVLWFYFKNSILDNAVDIWQCAQQSMEQEMKQQNKSTNERWMGSERLIKILKSGMKDCSLDEKIKIVYGFEQVLPQVAYL